MIATSGFLTSLEFTKFVFGRGSARYRTGEFTVLGGLCAADPLAGLKG